ncbi:MAG TPA: hypothetical protein VL051_09535 [Burkholderiaceae bacterium]|nr:hypothetical protein [Burkholderiaceae bacterium]
MSLQPGEGAKFPVLAAGEWFPATIVRADGVFEIVEVTARAADVLTIVRGRENTSAAAFVAGDRVELRLTAGTFNTEMARLDAKVDAAQDDADTGIEKADAAQGAADSAANTANNALPKAGGSMTGAINEAMAESVASAATPNIWDGDGNALHVTGTTMITGFADAPQAGARRKLIFDGAVMLKSGANLVVPGGDYTTAAGEMLEVVADTETKFLVQLSGGAKATETTRGVAQIASQVQTDAGTDDATIVTPKKLRFGFAISANQNGYIVFPSWLGGLIIQWGAYPNVDPGTALEITLPIAYPKNNFMVYATAAEADTGVRHTIVRGRSKTLIVIDKGTGAYVGWLSIGN